MKKIFIKITASFFLLTIFSGCKKVLNENPKTIVKPDVFFTSPGSYTQGVIGIYRTLPSTIGSNSWLLRESFSDIIGPVSGAYEQGTPTWQNDHKPFFYCVRQIWGDCYTIIKDANFMIKNLESATVLSDTEKKALLGEVRFLRAYAYFQLVQCYGDVPLRTTPPEDFSTIQLKRSPEADVYKLIVEDLSFAEANMNATSATAGRVNKWVATALLAKVYLTMAGNPLKQTQYYTNAKEKALAVIGGPYTLLDDYASVFHNTAYTTESIWEQTYKKEGGNPLMQNSLPATGYSYILTPAAWFINSFPFGDKRKVWGIKQNYVWGMGAGAPTLSPFFTKFVNLSWVDSGYTSSQAGRLEYTVPFLRLGEMYLIAAEAENEMNGPANAYQYINTIRRRARINKADPSQVPDLSGLTKDQFRDAVLMERKWELHLEGSTWYDLKRTNTISKIQTVRGATLVHPIGAYNNTWYIPDVEIQNNNIPQNPLYQ